jgi:dephospho-CoA kinase
MSKIVCIAGLCGAGKSVVSSHFIKKGFQYLHIGYITMQILKDRKLEVNEQNERLVRESLRQEHGMAAYAILNLDRLKDLSSNYPVVADGLYSYSEYLVFKQNFSHNCIVIAVYAPPDLRYKRLQTRSERPLNEEMARSRDHAEITKLEKGGPIAMADITIMNTGNFEYLEKQCLEVIHDIQSRQ